MILSGKSAAVVFVMALLASPLSASAIDGDQWQNFIPDWKLMYVTGVIESWMHESHLAGLLKQKVPDSQENLGTTFDTFIPCLRDKKATPTQLVAAVDTYPYQHPDHKKQSMAAIVWTATYEFCR